MKKIRIFKSPSKVLKDNKNSLSKRGKKNPMYGKKPWNYKGGVSSRKSGSRKQVYKTITVNGKTVVEHRYLMEKFLGRKLRKTEIIHHIDGNSLNNNISNLMIMTHKEHQLVHKCWENLRKGGGAK